MYCMECGSEISPDAESCGKCEEKAGLVDTATAGTQTTPLSQLKAIEQASENPSKPLAKKSSAKYAVLGGVLAAAVFLAGVGYKLLTTPIYSVDTVAGKFEIINLEKDGGEVDYKLNGKTVLKTTEMHGATAEIHDVFRLNDRSLLVITWDINNSKISRDKFIVYFYEIDKNGNFRNFFDGFSTNNKRIAVIESKGSFEFQIRVEPEQIGYQRVVFDVDGARIISNWKWADENRERERQQQKASSQQNYAEADIETQIRGYKEILDQSSKPQCKVFVAELDYAIGVGNANGMQQPAVKIIANRVISQATERGCL